MSEPGDEHNVRVRGMDDQSPDLLHVSKSDVLPRLAAVGRLEDAVTDAEVRTMEPLAGADVDDVGIGPRDADVTDRPGRRAVEDRPPRPSVVVGLPHAAGVNAGEEDVRLRRDADAGDRPAGAEWSDQAVAKVLIAGDVDARCGSLCCERGNAQHGGEKSSKHAVSLLPISGRSQELPRHAKTYFNEACRPKDRYDRGCFFDRARSGPCV